jgi:phosphatidylinositol glycan class N
MLGGLLMVVIGTVYLIFEDFILADFSPVMKPTSPGSPITRGLVGVQIGLTILAMIVTRSSALSLQAKLGLPPGNQIIGWIVLGK